MSPANPLSPLSDSALNARSPPTAQKAQFQSLSSASPTPKSTIPDEDVIDWDAPPSSPFVTDVEFNVRSPAKSSSPGKHESSRKTAATYERIEDITTLSRIDAKQTQAFEILEDERHERVASESLFKPPSPVKSFIATAGLRKASPTKGAPNKSAHQDFCDADELTMTVGDVEPARKQDTSPREPPPAESNISATLPERSLRDNEGLTTTTEKMMEQSRNATIPDDFELPDATFMTAGEQTNIDDTCFSAFSEIPDMTVFAKLGGNSARSPTKPSGFGSCRTPQANAPSTPGTSRKRVSPSRSPSPTPRRQRTPARNGDNNTTSLLLDFTQQIEAFSSIRSQKSPMRSHRPSPAKSTTEPNLLSFINGQRSPTKGRGYGTPSKNSNILNLLDFELPPAPTPRSIPTITVRELESLKSSYLSEISSLKATLHGREAEVESLKKAVGDAERRVGEALETVREERSTREHVEKEKAEWEKRGTEVEAVLMSVKEEVMRSDREKEDLVRKVDHCARKLEEAETRAVEAEQKGARAVEAEQKAVRAVELAGIASEGGDMSAKTEELVQRQVQAQLDQKIEAVSRELHAVYKKKHETKVATLKKSYEARSEKKCAELQTRIEELQAAKGTSSPTKTSNGSDMKRLEEQRAEIQDQKSRLADLADKVQTLKISHAQLLAELEKERVEKGELVAAVDEMLSLQSEAGAPSAIEDFRRSISKPSGMRGPGFGGNGESRIGRVGAPSLLGRSVSGGKSRIMSNIERMGGGRTAE